MALTTSSYGLLLLVLFGVAQGWLVRRDSLAGEIAISPHLGAAALFARQDSTNCADDISDPDTPLCSSLCAPSSFSCSSRPVERRNAPAYRPVEGLHTIANGSTLHDPYENHLVARRLTKRAFVPVTQGQIATYLPNQFNGNADPYFGVPTALVTNPETDDTVVKQVEFGAQPFAVGSRGLHGCTMVTIISDQAVYMGHFWEVPSVSGTPTQFSQRVLNFFAGGTIVGQGPQLNPALFPAASTRVYIMTGRNGRNNPKSTRYRVKIPNLITTIKNALNNQNVPLALYNYIPLEYEDPADEAQIGNNQRGAALFQFDPNGRGAGQPGWRLFYEQHQFQDTDPAPGPDSATGIPDI